jgi:hypothetical protein
VSLSTCQCTISSIAKTRSSLPLPCTTQHRFADRPEIYKSFLQILSDFKKKTETECTSTDISDVYELVAKLFQNESDLLREFTQFLPPAAAPAEPKPRKKTSQKPVCLRCSLYFVILIVEMLTCQPFSLFLSFFVCAGVLVFASRLLVLRRAVKKMAATNQLTMIVAVMTMTCHSSARQRTISMNESTKI